MDFKSLINKISSMDDKIETVAAPELPKSLQLNEDAQLRVLAGTSSILEEAKKMKKDEEKKEEKVAEEMKVGDSKKTAKGGTVTKTKTGIVHKAGPGVYGGSDDKDTDPDADDDAPKAKKAKKESIDPEVFKSKFLRMVEAKKSGKKPDDDNDGVPNWADKKPGEDDNAGKKKDGKKGMSAKQEKYFGKKKVKESVVSELSKDTLKSYKAKNMDSGRSAMIKGDEKTLAKRTAGKDAVEKKLSKQDESKMMPKGKKRPVKESVEQKLTFKQMVQLVQESGGQQQIDAVDTELFNWAQRVAKNKLGEGMKAELYAGLIYERNGGVFEMYDVLAENQK
jgi:hypothetical protein